MFLEQTKWGFKANNNNDNTNCSYFKGNPMAVLAERKNDLSLMSTAFVLSADCVMGLSTNVSISVQFSRAARHRETEPHFRTHRFRAVLQCDLVRVRDPPNRVLKEENPAPRWVIQHIWGEAHSTFTGKTMFKDCITEVLTQSFKNQEIKNMRISYFCTSR